MQKDASRRRFPLADRVIEVIDDTLTGEVLLDEALKMMKQSEKMSVASWIDLMSGMQTPKQTSDSRSHHCYDTDTASEATYLANTACFTMYHTTAHHLALQIPCHHRMKHV